MTIIYLINHSTSKLFNEFYTYEKWEKIQETAVSPPRNSGKSKKKVKGLIKLQSGATSLFDVQRWAFDVRRSSLKTTLCGINVTCECSQTKRVRNVSKNASRRLPAQQHIDSLHAHHNIMFLIYDFDK